jgi:hypothetical protein
LAKAELLVDEAGMVRQFPEMTRQAEMRLAGKI